MLVYDFAACQAAALLYGAHDDVIRDGLFGYNAALTSMALAGVFYVGILPALLYTVVGVLITARTGEPRSVCVWNAAACRSLPRHLSS